VRALVVGAGLAGLVAADELARAGAEVVVLEARPRVGGRVWSQTLPNGAVVEMGAEYILPGNTAILELVERFGLGLWDKGMRYGRRQPCGGTGTTHEELTVAMETVEAALGTAAHAEESAEDFLDSIEIPAGARGAILARLEISCAKTADRVAASDLAGVAHIDEERSPSVARGNQRLALALAGELGSAVRLDDPVTLVRWGERVQAATRGGELEADVCVIAVPASVLDRIAFEPALPRAVRDALERVKYGHAAKLFVPLTSPARPSAVMSVPERYWTWTATGDGGDAQPVVSAFAGSAPALVALQTAAGPTRWLDSLERLRPDLDLDTGGAVLSTWDNDPWVRAAYSTSPPPELAAAVERPTGPLAFAGEHTAGEHAGLMEGAIRSGRRAARSLLAA
jgi:monoamine oxidase